MFLNKKFLWGMAAATVLTGCIDNNYDLADIDTESEFKIKDLVLPVQLDPVMLDDIIVIEEDDQIKKVTINGKTFYAVEEVGTFESDDINIHTFAAEPKEMNPNTATFRLAGSDSKQIKRKADAPSRVYNITSRVPESMSYTADDVDGSVRELTKVFYDNGVDFIININTSSLTSAISSKFENISLQLPHGLSIVSVTADGYTYNPSDYNFETGLLKITSLSTKNNSTSIAIKSNAIDLKNYDNPYTYDAQKNAGSFDLESEFSIEMGCVLTLTGNDADLANLPEEIVFDVTYTVTELEATSILGSIEYDLSGTGLDIEPIDLSNLPEFLDNEETNLILANPQIYLNLENPVSDFGLGYESGLSIISFRNSGDTAFELDEKIEVPGKPGSFNFLLAPDPNSVTNYPEGYANPTKMVYSNLGNILAGEGLPEKLDIELIDPMIPIQKLTEPLSLGVNIPGMKGSYTFLAPLALDGDSRIIYTKTEDGWWSEDLDGLTITTLGITAKASSTIPLNATLEVFPLDKDGKQIPNLQILPVHIPAEGKDIDVVFEITGTITDLDGVFIAATVVPNDSEEPLAPDQMITLTNIRAKVSGNYTKKF